MSQLGIVGKMAFADHLRMIVARFGRRSHTTASNPIPPCFTASRPVRKVLSSLKSFLEAGRPLPKLW